VAQADLGAENVAAVQKGCANLARHTRNVKTFGVPVVVAINRFPTDSDAEIQAIQRVVEQYGARAILCNHWAEGGPGAAELAREVVRLVDGGSAQFAPLYSDDLPLWDKVKAIATHLYEADDIIADKRIRKQFREFQEAGYGHFPVCMAKTQYSFSTDPNLKGAPSNHVVPIRELRLAGGAEFLVVVCGEVMTMPGLPRVPSASRIGLDENGDVVGLF